MSAITLQQAFADYLNGNALCWRCFGQGHDVVERATVHIRDRAGVVVLAYCDGCYAVMGELAFQGREVVRAQGNAAAAGRRA